MATHVSLGIDNTTRDEKEIKGDDQNWGIAQSIRFSVDVVASTTRLRALLSAVDRHACLHVEHGAALSTAIRRYEECWLPLLASCPGGFIPRSSSSSSSSRPLPLRPPLDCDWVWLCHRLSPVAYARDCELHYGRLLGVPPYLDSPEVIKGNELFWNRSFPHEPYTLDLTVFADGHNHPSSTNYKSKIDYNFHAAVDRQRKFSYQVSEQHMGDVRFLRAAEQRYKGFLQLFRMTDSKFFLVPTYDIYLIWHAHQLNPIAYRDDMTQILGRVLNHNNSDFDRTADLKLQQGFMQTCSLWFQTYGSVYQRAGAMYRGERPCTIPRSVFLQPTLPQVVGTAPDSIPKADREVMKVFMAVIAGRNIPASEKGKVSVRLEMQKKASSFFLDSVAAPSSSEITWNQQWTFGVEASTEAFVLKLQLRRSMKQLLRCISSRTEVLGAVCFPWWKVLELPSLAYNGWVDLESSSDQTPKPSLFISVSVTPPQVAPWLMRTIKSIPTDDIGAMRKWVWRAPGLWLTRIVLDHASREVFMIRVRHCGGKSFGYKRIPESGKCIYIHQGGWQYKDQTNRGTAPAKVVASACQVVSGEETREELCWRRCWGFFGNTTRLTVTRQRTSGRNLSPALELAGSLQNQIRLEWGRKLEYQVHGATDRDEEEGFVTLIRYDPIDAPLGRAAALFNWRTGAMEVSPNESVILVLLLSTIISKSMSDMNGPYVILRGSPVLPKRSKQSSNEWGAVVLRGSNASKSMVPYHCWWDISPSKWVSVFDGHDSELYETSVEAIVVHLLVNLVLQALLSVVFHCLF